MNPPPDRRDFLRTAVAGVVGAVGLPATPAAAAPPYDRTLPAGWTYPVAPELLPFGHGVMSGDPQGISSVHVRWLIARDVGLTDVVRRGAVTTSTARDWTVKVDADRLPAATTLLNAFEALGYRSPIGRTRTAPAAGAARVDGDPHRPAGRDRPLRAVARRGLADQSKRSTSRNRNITG